MDIVPVVPASYSGSGGDCFAGGELTAWWPNGGHGWLAAAGGILLVHLGLSLTVPEQGWVTSLGVGSMLLLAFALCLAEFKRAEPSLRWRWALLGMGFLLWATGYAAIAWLQSVEKADHSVARIDTLLFMLRGVPWFLLVSRSSDVETGPYMRRVEAAQALLFSLLAAFLLFPRLVAGDWIAVPVVSAHTALSFHDLENFGLAALAIISLLVQPTDAERRMAGLTALLLCTYAVQAFLINHFVLATLDPPPGTPILLFASLPALLFILMVLGNRGLAPARMVPDPPRLFADAVRLLSPAFLAIVLLDMAFALSQVHFQAGLMAGLAGMLLFAIRSTLSQLAFQEARRALTDARDRMEELAQIDALTDLPNRRRFDQAMASEWRRAARGRLPLGVLMADVDEFKLYNDSEGHLAGDECLRLVAQAMRGVLHREGDLLARYGGEEFVLIAPGADIQGVLTLAERIRRAVEALALPHPTGTHRVVTISVGATCGWPGVFPATPSDLVQAADKAMYRAKLAGRNCVDADAVPPAMVAIRS